MSVWRMRARRDANEGAIVEALEAAGASVAKLSGRGVPDLICFHQGRVWLVEVKTKHGRITADQARWALKWNGPAPRIVRSVDEALEMLK